MILNYFLLAGSVFVLSKLVYNFSRISHKNKTVGMFLINRISPHCLAIVVGIEKAEKLIKALLVLN